METLLRIQVTKTDGKLVCDKKKKTEWLRARKLREYSLEDE